MAPYGSAAGPHGLYKCSQSITRPILPQMGPSPRIFAKDLPRKSKNQQKKNLFGHYLNPSRKKKRDLNRISLTLSNRRSLISVCSLTLSNRFLLRPSAPDMRITPDLHHLSSKKTLRTFHGNFSVSHFPISLHICSK